MGLFLLQRRGTDGPPDRAMIVAAKTEAHARVQAYARNSDPAWTDQRTSCAQFVDNTEEDFVMFTIYAGGKHDG